MRLLLERYQKQTKHRRNTLDSITLNKHCTSTTHTQLPHSLVIILLAPILPLHLPLPTPKHGLQVPLPPKPLTKLTLTLPNLLLPLHRRTRQYLHSIPRHRRRIRPRRAQTTRERDIVVPAHREGAETAPSVADRVRTDETQGAAVAGVGAMGFAGL